MNDYRKQLEQPGGSVIPLRNRFDAAAATGTAGDVNGIISLLKANIEDPDQAEAIAGMTYTLAKTYNQDPLTILKDLDGWAARYNGSIQPKKTAWQQIKDGAVSGWYTDQLGLYGAALMDDYRSPEEKQMYKDKIAELKANMPNTAGDSKNLVVKTFTSTANLLGTMARPLLTNIAVSTLIPAAKLPIVAAQLGKEIPAIAVKVAGHAISFGTTWATTAEVEAGNIYIDMLENGVDEDIAKKYANIHGAIAGALEAAPLEFAFTRFPFLKTAAQKAFLNLGTNTRAKQAIVKSFAGILQKNLISVPLNVLAETSTEALQEVSSIYFEKKAALALADEIKDEKLKKMLPEVYSEWRDLYNKEVGEREAYYESQDYKNYVADRVWDVVVQTALGTGPISFLGAAGQTISDARYSSQLKKDAENIPSKEFFIRFHKDDEKLGDMTAAQRKDTLGEIYDKNHTIEGVSNAEAANLDTDYLEINESADEEESEAQATDTPQEPIKRRKDHRLHTQESTTVTENADGSESHTLKLGSADSRRRYGRIEFTVNGDTVTIDNVYLKAGQEALTGEFVTELMRRYEGYNIEWQPTTESQIKVRDQLIKDNKENPGQLQMFKGRNMDEVLEAAGYIKEKLPNLNRHEATVAAGLMRVIAEGRGRTLQQFIHDDIQFKTFAEAVANDVMSEQEAALNKGAYQLIENGTKAIIYVGKEGDFSTLFHEVVHFISQTSPQSKDLATALKGAADTDQFRQYLEQHKRIMDSTGLKTADDIINAIKEMSDNPMEWNRAQNEIVAVLGETYAQEGRTFNSELKGLFDKIIDFFMKIYRMMKQNALLNDDIVKAYDALLAGNPELKAQMERSEQAETAQGNGQVLHQGKPSAEELAEAERQYKEIEAQYKDTEQWMKAPNGKPTKLTERQWVQVRTPNFKKWFGDWENDPQNASKVVDENGEPMVVYHGTDYGGFDTFNKSDNGIFFSSIDRASWYAKASYNPEVIRNFDGNNSESGMYAVFLNIRKPRIINARGRWAGNINQTRISGKQDGVIVNNVVDGTHEEGSKFKDTNYIAFSPNQIKSATDNVGTFSHSNLSILYQPAYHGSGADFDKFDTDFMGTGEGAQAFGWGIYLTQSEGIARSYAEQYVSRSRDDAYDFYSKGEKVNTEIHNMLRNWYWGDIGRTALEKSASGNHTDARKAFSDTMESFRKWENYAKEGLKEFDELIEKISKMKGISADEVQKLADEAKNDKAKLALWYVKSFEERNRLNKETRKEQAISNLNIERKALADDIKVHEDKQAMLKTVDVDSFEAVKRETPRRNLYTASIPDDTGNNYLYWDKPLTDEQIGNILAVRQSNYNKLSDEIKKQQIKYYKNNSPLGKTGEKAYWYIADMEKESGYHKPDPEAASKLLSRAGFVGIDYPANSMSGGNKDGKRNFVIFNADDITIDNHLQFQPKSREEIEDSLIADAKGQTLDEWLDFNRFLGDSNLDEAALTAIWEKANHVTEVEGEKVVEAAPLSEEEKDTAFRAMIDTDDGVRKFIQDLRSVDAYIRDIEREGMSDEEDMDFLNRLADASKRIETEAAPFIKNLLKNNNELSEESIKKVRGMVVRNLAAYRDLYAAASGNENLTSNIEALPFIDEPTRERMQTMSIAEKRRLVDNLEAQELKKKILKGEELYEGEAEKVVKMLDAEIQKLEGEKEALKASLDNKQDWLDIKEKKLLNAAEEAKATEKAINKLERNIRSRLDKGMRISKEDYQKLAGWKDKLELLQDDVNALNKQTKLKAILQEREKYRQKQAELKQKQKERQFAKKVHDYKVKLASYIMKKPSKTVNWEQAEQILALQAVFGRTSGYDNFFINMNGKRLNLTAFRGMIDRGEINIAGLTDYQLKRYFNKSLAEYTVQDLEILADTVRYLTEQGRHEWQAKVDQRAFEAMQWQNLLINEIAGNPRYTDAGDEPLPETGESEKKKRTFAQLVRTGWYKTLNMARKAQILDGNRKATAYRLLVEEKRAVQEREYKAIRKRMKPVTELMEKLGVKAEDFYEMHTLKIGKNEQHYTTSQLIYGLKAQLEQRNMEAFVYGNLISQREKEFYGHNDNSLRLIGEARLDDFIKQAQAILAGKENIMKVAEAIWNDWQDKDNFARLNRAAIDEYNMPVDPVAFYMPISRKDFNGTELAAKIADDLYNTNAGKGMTAVEKGMTKTRLTISPDHQMPVDMDYFKLWTDSVADQEHFIASNAYVRKLNRVFKALGSKDLRANIEAVYGQGMMNDIDNYINEVANPNINTDTQGVNKFLSFLRGALYPAYLAFKSSSVILQMITSPAPFLREVGPVELAKGLIQMSLHPVETWKYVTERSAMMENRSMNPLIDEIEKAAQNYTDPKYKRLWHKIQETGTMGLEMADRWAVTAGWLAVLDKKKAEYEAQGMGARQAEREAVKYADAVVLETQPTGDKTELAPLFKVGGPAWQAFTQFQVSLNVIWNNLTYDVANSDFRNHEVRKAMGTLIGYALAGVILYSVQEGFDDDDDAEDIILKLLYGATTQYTSSIPLVSSNIDNIIKSKMTGEAWYSRGSQLYPGLDALAQGVATGNVDKLARAVGIFFGAPVSGWKEFEHSFYNRKKGEWRFYPKAFLGRREK